MEAAEIISRYEFSTSEVLKAAENKDTSTVDRRPDSARPWTARTAENVDLVGDLVLRYEAALQTYLSVRGNFQGIPEFDGR